MTRLSAEAIRKDFKALGQLGEGAGAQVVFPSVPSVAGKTAPNAERGKETELQLAGWGLSLLVPVWDCA